MPSIFCQDQSSQPRGFNFRNLPDWLKQLDCVETLVVEYLAERSSVSISEGHPNVKPAWYSKLFDDLRILSRKLSEPYIKQIKCPG